MIIATDRAARPDDFKRYAQQTSPYPHDPTCPFCPGNESQTPDEIQCFPAHGDWQQRVVPNKFAALSAHVLPIRQNNGLFHSMEGFGFHEVVIESAVHNHSLINLDAQQMTQLFAVYRERFICLDQTPNIQHVIVFKNHGLDAGTSLAHPHSQIIATPVLPMQVRERMHAYRTYHDQTGQCLMCDTLNDERNDGRRILFESEHFVSFIPFAALSPFHIWIFPRQHAASFAHTTDEAIADVAIHLQKVLKLLYIALGDPSYNYMIRSDASQSYHSDSFHWYISIVPRVSHAAGFELGSGMFINAAIPEESATFLRRFFA